MPRQREGRGNKDVGRKPKPYSCQLNRRWKWQRAVLVRTHTMDLACTCTLRLLVKEVPEGRWEGGGEEQKPRGRGKSKWEMILGISTEGQHKEGSHLPLAELRHLNHMLKLFWAQHGPMLWTHCPACLFSHTNPSVTLTLLPAGKALSEPQWWLIEVPWPLWAPPPTKHL